MKAISYDWYIISNKADILVLIMFVFFSYYEQSTQDYDNAFAGIEIGYERLEITTVRYNGFAKPSTIFNIDWW